MQLYKICGIVSGILILIGSLICLKEAMAMDTILGKHFQNCFPYFR